MELFQHGHRPLAELGGTRPRTTWANNASTWGLWLSTAWTQSCNDTRKRVEFGGGNLLSATQQATGWAIMTVGLREVDEAHNEPWKKFDAGTALLSIEYNSYPNKPDQLSVDNKPCATGPNRPYVTTTRPVLRARLSDPDAAQLLNGGFSWARPGTPLSRDHYSGQDNIANGGTLTVRVPDGELTDGATYYTQAGVGDYTDLGPSSDFCEFTVDATPPDPPKAVSSTDYLADGGIHGGIGKAGTFTNTPPDAHQDDVTGYLYALTPMTQPTAGIIVQARADKSAAVPIVPTIDGVNVLRIWARDKAGNLSDIVHPLTYTFSAGEGALPVGQWSFTEGSGTAVADGIGGHPLTLSGGTWTSGRPGSAISLGNDWGHTNGKVLTTNAGFSVAAWVRLTDTGQWRTAVSQDGTHASGFFLQYDKDADAWAFTLPGSDADNAPLARAVSAANAQVGVWTHLTGV